MKRAILAIGVAMAVVVPAILWAQNDDRITVERVDDAEKYRVLADLLNRRRNVNDQRMPDPVQATTPEASDVFGDVVILTSGERQLPLLARPRLVLLGDSWWIHGIRIHDPHRGSEHWTRFDLVSSAVSFTHEQFEQSQLDGQDEVRQN